MKTLFFMLATLLVVHASHAAPQPAYAANTGWINLTPSAEHRVTAHATFLSGWAWSGNLGWIHFGDGSPANGTSYANDSAADFGVNRDGSGFLSGYAYSANAGWIQFGSASLTGDQKSRYQAATDTLSGYAYSANTGWLFLGEAPPPVDDTNLALDTNAAPLAFTGGSGFTTVTGTQAQDDVDALKAASLDANNFTERVLSFTVTGPARVRVWRKLVDPDGYGNFVMQLNGASLFTTSAFGTNEWAQVMLPVPRGTHTVSLVAASYAYGTSTPPQIFLDQLTVTPGVVPLSEFITSPPAGGFRQPYGSPIFMSVQTMANSAFTFQWRKDGADLPGRTMPNLEIFNFQAADAGYYTVRVSDGVDSWESLPILQAPFVASDPWFTQTSVDRDGGGAWQSGATPHWGESQRNEFLNGVGTLRFWWKVSSESGKDFLRFNWNGQVSSISGEQDWQLVERVVNHGDPAFHLASWTYAKDGAGTAGSDAAWVDGIEFIPGNAAPQISSAAPSGNLPYGLWTHQVTVTDADDTAFTFSLLNAPSGMSISSSGLITWNTTDAGTSSGTVTIRAADGGENNAPAAMQTFSVAVVPRSVTWTLSNLLQTYDGSAKSVTVTSDPPGVAASLTYNSSATAPVNAGDYTASAAPTNANYTGTSSATLTIQKAAQTITFPEIPEKSTSSPSFAHGAVSSSGLPLSVMSSNTAVAVISGNLVLIVGEGTCTLTASQSGNENYHGASVVARVLTVTSGQPPLSPHTVFTHEKTTSAAREVVQVAAHRMDAITCDHITSGVPGPANANLHFYGLSGGAWTLVQAAHHEQHDFRRVALHSGIAVAAAIFSPHDPVNPHPDYLGRAFVWEKSGGVWTQTSELRPKTPLSNNPNNVGYPYGGAVALHGDTCAVAHVQARRVVVFVREPSGVWLEQAVLSMPKEVSERFVFGECLALDGDRLLVGARDDHATQPGRVFVFTRAAGTWSLETSLSSPHGALGSQFGSSVDIWQDWAVIGDPSLDLGGPNEFPGAAHVYRRVAGVWTAQPDLRLIPFNGIFGDGFGALTRYATQVAVEDGRIVLAGTEGLGDSDRCFIQTFSIGMGGLITHSGSAARSRTSLSYPYGELTGAQAFTIASAPNLLQARDYWVSNIAISGDYLFTSHPTAEHRVIHNGSLISSGNSGLAYAWTLPQPPTNYTPDTLHASTSQFSNPVNGMVVSTLSATDPDGAGFTFSLVSGAGADHNAFFAIANGNELRISNASALDVLAYAHVRLRVTDAQGAFFERSLSLRHDNAYTQWAGTRHGADHGSAAPDADPDGNGVANLLEFAANDDQLAQNGGQMLFGGDPAPRLFMDFDLDDVRAGQITLAGEGSDDLITWTPVTLQIVSQSGGRRVVRLIDSVTSQSHTRRFIRLRAGL
jgi:hypothetical protein